MNKMMTQCVFTVFVVFMLTAFVSASDAENGGASSAQTKSPTAQPTVNQTQVLSTLAPKNTTSNETHLDKGPFSSLMENKGMLWRTFYVLLGFTSLVVVYFGVRAWRSRRRQNKSRKYGLITTRGADLEMEPLDQDMDDDDDMTVFELNGRRK